MARRKVKKGTFRSILTSLRPTNTSKLHIARRGTTTRVLSTAASIRNISIRIVEALENGKEIRNIMRNVERTILRSPVNYPWLLLNIRNIKKSKLETLALCPPRSNVNYRCWNYKPSKTRNKDGF